MTAKRLKPRKHARREVTLEASCRSSDGAAREAELTNLSEGGCRMRLREGEVLPNQIVAVRPRSLEAVSGVVRWCIDGVAGVEFAASLYPAVVDHLAAQRPSPVEPVAVPRAWAGVGRSGFLDGFGRSLPPLGERRTRSRG